jgi:chemotaxis protein MotB
MAKKHKHPEHENLERWLVSYADFITLLFATFTALYALSQADISKMKDVSKAIREGFQEQSLLSGIKSVMQGQSPPNDNPNPIASEKGAGEGVVGNYESLTYKPGEMKKVDEEYPKLEEEIEKANEAIKAATAAGQESDGTKPGEAAAQGISSAIQERGLKVSFDSRLLFEPGTAILKPESEKILKNIAKRLVPFSFTNTIQVEGHTDSQPTSSAQYPSNWELSTARASVVVRKLIEAGYTSTGLIAAGYGDSRPIANNNTPEGRRANRRVDIIIMSKQVGDSNDPSKQFMKQTDLINAPKPTPSQVPEKSHGTMVHEETNDNPVNIIIQEKDGTQRVLKPKVLHQESAPAHSESSSSTGESSTTTKPTIKPAVKPNMGQIKPAVTPVRYEKKPTPAKASSTPPVPGGSH